MHSDSPAANGGRSFESGYSHLVLPECELRHIRRRGPAYSDITCVILPDLDQPQMAGFVSLASYHPLRGKLFDPDPADSVEKVFAAVGTKFLRALMRLTPSDTVDHVDLNRSFRRPSSSHEERILRRNLPPASFCENFVLAVFSTFSTVSARRRPLAASARRSAVWGKADSLCSARVVPGVTRSSGPLPT